MARWQDEWKTIYQSDSEWLRSKKDGTEPTIEVAEEVGEYEDEEGFTRKKFQLYRFDIERFKLVHDPDDYKIGYLVSERYEPSWPHSLASYEEWFAKDLDKVASYVGENPLALAEAFTSEDPTVRAGAYMAVAGYHGLANFDGDPLEINEPNLDKRWG
jgi:hypothetical protein